MKEHVICLKGEARKRLQELVQSGTRSVRVVRRALILLKSDEGFTDEEIAVHVGCSDRTVRSVRKRFCRGSLEDALYDAPRSGAPPTFTPRQQQQVIALACTDPPEGRSRWTLELLCEHAVKQGFVKSVSKSEVALWLKEHDMKPWRKKNLVHPQTH
jgi:transposase